MGFKGFRGFLCTSLPSRGPSVFCYRTSEITDLVPSDQFFDFSFLIYSSFRKKNQPTRQKNFPPPPSAINSRCALGAQAHARLDNFNE